ncbi:MAG TPA: 1-(5-phosphoribosyl)-5-[(5-phosphoribosylamino)methylideneamino]imidazole-4-carboxamide isomerase [Actinomycetota bacterium]|nr:1-(5-phosphoribosyl)-5-[(5-phosphoribosylamino)methylideneamino]imidazole-4-carboxamide isomerase [Actinomycetota bacterium]
MTEIIVAIDIVEDQVVRLRQGELLERTVYGDDPIETAIRWEAQGATRLHVIDLDGATRGDASNSEAVERIISAVRIPVQVGGGIRSIDSIERWLEKGAARICVGTRSLDPTFLKEAIEVAGDRLIVAIDSRGGEVKVAGWLEGTGTRALDLAKQVESAGVSRIIFTDIERDGTLLGPNVEAIDELLSEVGIPVIASGGVSSDIDVMALAKLHERGLEGIIIGKALYSGALTLEVAQAAAEG